MKFKIIVDSSGNMKSDYIKDKDVGFAVAPLTMRIDDVEYVDDDNIDVDKLLAAIDKTKGKPTSSCPSPSVFLSCYEDCDYAIVITISAKLSGSFNSATLAASMTNKANNIFVLDSKAVAGSIQILADKCYELIKKGLNFEDIRKELTYTRDSLDLLFVLNKFDNLVRNGRMNKVTAFIATKMSIKPLCYADDGEIKVKEKIRTLEGTYKRLVANIEKFASHTKGKSCIIAHTKNLEGAQILEKSIAQKYHFAKILIVENRGLCAFYSLKGGIMVSF